MNVTRCDIQEINPDYIQELAEIHSVERIIHNEKQLPLMQEKKKFIEENIQCGPSVLDDTKNKYFELLMKHHAVVSQHGSREDHDHGTRNPSQ